jgi:proteasome assembly chaperone (PAC2) family protein
MGKIFIELIKLLTLKIEEWDLNARTKRINKSREKIKKLKFKLEVEEKVLNYLAQDLRRFIFEKINN